MDHFLSYDEITSRFIVSQNCDLFQSNSDFFYWIYYHHICNNSISDFKIEDISDLNGSQHVKIKLKYSGDGAGAGQYFSEINMSVIERRNFSEIELEIQFSDKFYIFRYSSNGYIQVKFNKCDDYSNIEEFQNANILKVLYIYQHIIPALKKAYISDEDWKNNGRKKLREHAKDNVIKRIEKLFTQTNLNDPF